MKLSSYRYTFRMCSLVCPKGNRRLLAPALLSTSEAGRQHGQSSAAIRGGLHTTQQASIPAAASVAGGRVRQWSCRPGGPAAGTRRCGVRGYSRVRRVDGGRTQVDAELRNALWRACGVPGRPVPFLRREATPHCSLSCQSVSRAGLQGCNS